MSFVHVRRNGKTSGVFELHSIVPTHTAMTDEQRTLVWGENTRPSLGRATPHARLVGTQGELFEQNSGDRTAEIIDELPPKLKPYLESERTAPAPPARYTEHVRDRIPGHGGGLPVLGVQ